MKSIVSCNAERFAKVGLMTEISERISRAMMTFTVGRSDLVRNSPNKRRPLLLHVAFALDAAFNVHVCDKCGAHMHGFCGVGVGAGGYGQVRRCSHHHGGGH